MQKKENSYFIVYYFNTVKNHFKLKFLVHFIQKYNMSGLTAVIINHPF